MLTANDIADILDKARDELLVRERTTGVELDTEGRVCLQGAIGLACGLDLRPTRGTRYDDWRAVAQWDSNRIHNARVLMFSLRFLLANAAMKNRGYSFAWNDLRHTTDDDVFDALMTVAKELREKGDKWIAD